MSFAIRVENLGKRYQLGATHAGSVRELVNRGWNRMFGRSEPAARPVALGPDAADRLEGNAFWALRDVSFEVKPGEVVGIIGRNGSGKSTLLKILSQITAPTTGRIELRGRVASLLEVGTGFHPELSGRENVFLNGAILGMTKPEIRRKFDEIVAFTEMEQFLDTPVKRYSSGMYMRLAFSVAAHLEPEILIVDEVLAVGDMVFQQKCLGKMNEVGRSGRTVLFVSHNMAAVESLCGQGIVMNQGRVEFDGKQNDAVRFYSHSGKTSRLLGQYQEDNLPHVSRNKPFRLVSAKMTSDGKECGGCFAIGAPLEFTVEIEANSEVQLPQVDIGINNNRGLRITTLNTDCDLTRMAPAMREKKNRVVCKVDNMNLMPGDYTVTLCLLESGHSFDIVKDAVHFTVLPTDFFGNSGKYCPGVVLYKQSWCVEKIE
jgi:lipopolysaccharide transport system ATP-binding protein